MKKLLIFANILLACFITALIFSNLSLRARGGKKPSAGVSAGSSVRSAREGKGARTAKGGKKSKTKRSGGAETASSAEPVKLLPVDAAVDKIVEKDVFNQVRSPLANTRVGRGDMTLVGVFKMGDVEGAIIKTTARQMQFNPFLAQAMRMSGNMNGRPGGAPGGGPGGRFTQWSQVSGRNSAPVKQYVRVGETMGNGYTLAEISRSRAILVRGNDKVELELQDPSKNRTAASAPRQPRLNSTQQFQQAQMFMQSQMIRTMREIQQSARGGSAPAGNRNRR